MSATKCVVCGHIGTPDDPVNCKADAAGKRKRGKKRETVSLCFDSLACTSRLLDSMEGAGA